MKYYCYNILIVFSIDLWKVLANVHNVDNDIELDGPVVKTKYGPVQGVVRKGHYEFRGIPYMKPALGELRYQVFWRKSKIIRILCSLHKTLT